uniref:Uncharacterized protein n=1 Tax=Schistosoma curassoni TaxID=6186 RepID=A0A183L2S6_9TREM
MSYKIYRRRNLVFGCQISNLTCESLIPTLSLLGSINTLKNLILLHWHNYSIPKAVDDIPNYVPVYNKWTKGEVKKFLRCIDSKPRKNFVEAKKTVIPNYKIFKKFMLSIIELWFWLFLY